MSDASRLPQRFRFSHRQFMRRGALVAGIRISGLVSVFVLQILVARLMGDTAEYGIYAWGQSLMFMVGTIASMGIPVITARFIASLSTAGKFGEIRAVIRRSTLLLLSSSGVSIVAAALLWGYGHSRPSDNVYLEAALIALVFSPAITFCLFLRDICRAQQWLALALSPMQLVRPWVTAALFVLCWLLLPGSISGEAGLLLLGSGVVCVLLGHFVICYYRYQKNDKTDLTESSLPDFAPDKVFPTAFPVFLSRLAGQVITYSNILLVGFLAGPAAAGAYFAAERLASMAVLPGHIVSNVNQQSMAAMYAASERHSLQRVVKQSAHGSFWPTVIICTLLFFFAQPLLQLFGEDFDRAETALLILAASAAVKMAAGPAQDVLIMTGNQKSVPMVIAVAATLHVSALLLLVPEYGAAGAAVATLTSAIVSQLWLMLLAKSRAGIGTSIFHHSREAS